MKRVVKLTEQDLYRIVKRVIKEQAATTQPNNQPTATLEVFNVLPDILKNYIITNYNKNKNIPKIVLEALKGVDVKSTLPEGPQGNVTYTTTVGVKDQRSTPILNAYNMLIGGLTEKNLQVDPTTLMTALSSKIGTKNILKISDTNFYLVPMGNSTPPNFSLYYNGKPANDLFVRQTNTR